MSKYSGRIKSFNLQRGWGFIECSETEQIYGKDIFVMKKALPGGHASKGDRVIFEVVQGPSGPEAADVDLSPEGGGGGWGGGGYAGGGGPGTGNAIGSKAWAASRGPFGGSSGRSSTGFLGFVKSYNPVKGWGFVTSEAMHQLYGKDIFFMKNSLRPPHAQQGDPVRFTIVQGAKGPEATDVHLAPMAAPGFGGPSAGSRRRVIGAGPGVGGYWAPAPGRAFPALPALPAPGPASAAIGPGQMLFGSVKGYDPEKGWGHIDCEAARQAFGKDVFLMRSAVGDQSVQLGTLISFRVTMAAKGPHATDVRVLPESSFGIGGNLGGFWDGVVKSFNTERGWGFITSEEITQIFGKDIFLHRQELDGTQPEPGDAIHFTVEPGKTGQLEAKNVSLGTASSALEAAEAGPVAAYRDVPRPTTSGNRRARPY
uniref:CSD domain-containing protein n=1 Tax=Alexandrium monilatum TaxID=311494 RepID=A0A7S4QNB8_9DINO